MGPKSLQQLQKGQKNNHNRSQKSLWAINTHKQLWLPSAAISNQYSGEGLSHQSMNLCDCWVLHSCIYLCPLVWMVIMTNPYVNTSYWKPCYLTEWFFMQRWVSSYVFWVILPSLPAFTAIKMCKHKLSKCLTLAVIHKKLSETQQKCVKMLILQPFPRSVI